MEKKLKRSGEERLFLGVLGGLGEYLDVDPTLLRLGFLLLFVLYPVAMTVFYFLAAVLMPPEVEGGDLWERASLVAREVEEAFLGLHGRDEKVVGAAFVLLGVVLLDRVVLPAPFSARTVVAVVFIAIGTLLLLRRY